MKTLAAIVVLALLLAASPPAGWNAHAKQFTNAPSFDMPAVAGASGYRFTVRCGPVTKSFETKEPTASLAPIWDKIPPGVATVRVEVIGSGDVVLERTFHRAAPFRGPYGEPVVPYAESARIALDSVIHEPFVQSWRTTAQPDPKYPLYRYVSKIIGSLMSGCAMYARQSPRPADAGDALDIGRRAGAFLISASMPAGSPLEFFPPTYHGATSTDRENDNWTMLMSPAETGQGYLDLYDATRDEKYLTAAKRIAATYAKLQQPGGTWALKVDNRTGEPTAGIELIPSVVVTFLDRVGGSERTRDSAIAWIMANPAQTFDWRAQFDDAKVRGPYENLSKHEACEFASYLFRHHENIELAEQILQFAEDQFVVWEHPPDVEARSPNLKVENWFTPCSLEQYAMFEPISGSSAFMIMTYVRAHEATGKPIYLDKAKSLANALTVAQKHHGGRYPTRMVREDLAYWINSSINTVRAMNMLSAEMERTAQSQP